MEIKTVADLRQALDDGLFDHVSEPPKDITKQAAAVPEMELQSGPGVNAENFATGLSDSEQVDALPDDFPAGDKFVEAGYITIADVAHLRDSGSLETVPGVGEKTAAEAKDALAKMGR